MKLSLVTLSLLLALPLAAQAETKETRTWIHGRRVTVTTEVTTQTPALSLALVNHQVDQQGWHDHIYTTTENDRAYFIYSQRDNNACATCDTKVTLWKAVDKDGKTHVETWTYTLRPSEVNDFLDRELLKATGLFMRLAPTVR